MSLSYGFNLGMAGELYTSAQFSEAFHQLTEDHVANYSGKLDLALTGGLSFSIAPGFVFVKGRWAKLTGNSTFTLPIANAARERYDALAVLAHTNNRTVTVDVLSDIDPAAPPSSASVYAVYLYTFRVGMSQTDLVPEDITDRRKILLSYSGVAGECDAIYRYFFTTFPAEVARIRAHGQDAIDAWPAAKAALIQGHKAGREYVMGDIVMAATKPRPFTEWLECDGTAIPSAFSTLRAYLSSSTLPDITPQDDRLKAWIYAVAGYATRSYSGLVAVDDDTPDIPSTAGTSTDVDPVVPDPVDPDAVPETGLATRGGDGITTRGGDYILRRSAST